MTAEARKLVLLNARGEIGPGRPLTYWRDVFGGKPRPHGYPKEWCAAFVLWALHQAGLAQDILFEQGFGFLSEMANEKRVWRLPKTTKPEPGDIVYIDKPYQHHCLFVELEALPDLERDGFAHKRWLLHTIDGNQPDVREQRREYVPSLHPPPVFFSIGPWVAYP